MRLVEEYRAWNISIAEGLFPELSIPALAFLDLEGDALDELAEERGVESGNVIPELVSLVRRLLNTTTLTSTFDWFRTQTRRWRAAVALEPPPALGLLALFATAAERMERGDGISASNYCGQLSRLLGIDVDRVGGAATTAPPWCNSRTRSRTEPDTRTNWAPKRCSRQ